MYYLYSWYYLETDCLYESEDILKKSNTLTSNVYIKDAWMESFLEKEITSHTIESYVDYYLFCRSNNISMGCDFLKEYERSSQESDKLKSANTTFEILLQRTDDKEIINELFVPLYLFLNQLLENQGNFQWEQSVLHIINSKLHLENCDLIIYEAYSLFCLQKVKECKELLYTCIVRNPVEVRPHNYLVKILLENKDYEEAFNMLNEIKEKKIADDETQEYINRYNDLVKNAQGQKNEKQESDVKMWEDLDFYKKQVLVEFYKIKNFSGLQDFSNKTHIPMEYVHGHFNKLIQAGALVKNSNDRITIAPNLLSIVKESINKYEVKKSENMNIEIEERYKNLDFYKKKILYVILNAGGFNSHKELSVKVGSEERFIKGNLKKLEQGGFLTHISGVHYEVNEVIIPLLKSESWMF